MMCFWTAAICYLLEEIQIELNVRFRDQHYAFWVGKLVPKYREESEQIQIQIQIQIVYWQDKVGVAALNSTKCLCLGET